MSKRAQIKQTGKRTGRVYVYETEYRYDRTKKRTVLDTRKLIGHVDPDTGDIVPNRKTKPYVSSQTSKREFCGAAYLFDEICRVCGIKEDLANVAPDHADKVLSVVYYLLTEDKSPLMRFARWSRAHWHPFGQEITSQRSSELFASLNNDVKERFCILQA